MRKVVRWVLACTFMFIGSAASAADPANPLVSDKWNSRPLILVSPDETDRDYQRMRGMLADSTAEMNERDMVLYTVINGQGKRDGNAMTEYETRALLSALNLEAHGPLTVVLVGKDGGKKVELQGFVSPEQLFDTIDRMPMRQSDAP